MNNRPSLNNRVEALLGAPPVEMRPLLGGMIGQVYGLTLADGRRVVAKTADSADAKLAMEGFMLRYLANHSSLPVPQVLYSDDALLLMTFIEGDSRFGRAEQTHAAELVAALHAVRADQFGFAHDGVTDTIIATLNQPNPPTGSWLDFFRDQRLLYMAGVARDHRTLPAHVYARIERFAGRLGEFLLEPEHPSLLHGDLWTTNILAHQGRITGFLDPAIYYGHPEIELAFSTLFGTFGTPFFERYGELRPIPPGFFEARRDIYNLYPLLVHVRLFGGSYVHSVEQTLQKFGG